MNAAIMMCCSITKKWAALPFLLAIWLLFPGCAPNSYLLEPSINYVPPPGYIAHLDSPFPPLSTKERGQAWGKELWLASRFAQEEDYYRAITCYKSALFLMPDSCNRALEAEYGIFLSYYLGQRFGQAIEQFEGSRLKEVESGFPALEELLAALCEAYLKVNQPIKAENIRCLLSLMGKKELSSSLDLFSATVQADLCNAPFACDYLAGAKSVQAAQTLNALIPGAGYLYVGQGKTALTSFFLNTLFIAAAYQCFKHRNVPAGVIVSSFEFGWYVGGINGAGLAAKEYNERRYQTMAQNYLVQESLFPILLFQKGF